MVRQRLNGNYRDEKRNYRVANGDFFAKIMEK